MTTTCVYKLIDTGGREAYNNVRESPYSIVISLVEVPQLSSSLTHHLVAPLEMDLPTTYQDNAQKIVTLLDLAISKSWKVLVHCEQGRVRSPGVVQAYAQLRDPENASK